MESFHRYFIEPIKEIGKGTFGRVENINVWDYSLTQPTLFARKTLINTEDEETVKRFVKEAKTLISCNHTNIVRIILCDLYNKTPWFVMPLADNNLSYEIENNLLTIEDKIKVANSIISAIKYLHNHEKKIIHRDIKPNNILKYQDGTYKLADFGLTKHLNPSDNSEKLTQIGQWMGTPKYMAPESYHGDFTEKSDIYSIGIIFDELFNINNSHLSNIINTATAQRVNSRYNSIESLNQDFQIFANEVMKDV